MRLRVRFLLNLLLVPALLAVLVLVLHENEFSTRSEWSAGAVPSVGKQFRKCVTPTNSRIIIISNVTTKHIASVIQFEDAPVAIHADVKLIILTYMRSGSTFTGDLFNKHQGVFYIFEPLWSIEKYYSKAEPAFFFEKDKSIPNITQFYANDSMSVDIIRGFLNCSFRSIDTRTLTQWTLHMSLSPKPYLGCKARAPGIFGILRCLPVFQETCNKATVTAVKTIRFTMKQATELIRTDPRVKVIHLLRDPRATLASQATLAEFKREAVGNHSQRFCRRVLEDLKDAERVKMEFPGRLLTVRYEDLAWEPVALAERLLNFAGLTFSDRLKEQVLNMTSAGLKDDCSICTTRNSSRATSAAWRSKRFFSFSFFARIDKQCMEVYRRLGYLTLDTEDQLRNLTVPFYVDRAKVPDLWR